jgi:hypothetical protein
MWCRVSHLHKECPERALQHWYRHAATASWWMERNHIPPTIEAAPCQGRDAKEKVTESTQDYTVKGLFQPHHPWTGLRGGAAQQHTATAAASSIPSCTGLPHHSGRNECLTSLEAQPTTSTKSVSSGS